MAEQREKPAKARVLRSQILTPHRRDLAVLGYRRWP